MDDAQLKLALIAMIKKMASNPAAAGTQLDWLRERAVHDGVLAATGEVEYDSAKARSQQLLELLHQKGLIHTERDGWPIDGIYRLEYVTQKGEEFASAP